MKNDAPKRQTLAPAPLANRVPPFVVWSIALYAVVILSVSCLAGVWLYSWARQRIVQSISMPAPLAQHVVAEARAAPGAADGAMAPEESSREAVSSAASPAVPVIPAINILLLGTDERRDQFGPPLTDTIMLLSINPEAQTAGLLSLPRDLWVPIPGFKTYKINTAYSVGEQNTAGGGARLVKETVAGFIGQPVPYYVHINFQGFVDLINLIGGVDIEVPITIHDEAYPTADYGVETFHLEKGLQHLDGVTALKYVRTRNVDSDYGRAQRQQDLLRAIFEQVTSADMIPTLISQAPQLLLTMGSSIDTDIPLPTMLELANYGRGASLPGIRQLVLDNRFGEETTSEEGAWILLPDREKVRAALDEFFRPPAAVQQEGQSVAMAGSANVRIEVLNGTNQPGIAAATRDLLEASGWQVVAIGDADRKDYGRTLLISYGVPAQVVADVSADLHVAASSTTLQGLNTTMPVDMRIVVGSDLLPVVR